MDRLFLDANIFFAAACSANGGSRMLFHCAEQGIVTLLTSEYALQEAKRNIERKMNESELITFYTLISQLEGILKDDFKGAMELHKKLKGIVPQKDMPILVGAYGAEVDCLITLDRKDFMNSKVNKAVVPFNVKTPGEYLQRLV